MRPVLVLISGMLAIAASAAYATPPPSGFLDTYPTMKPDPQRPGASLYVAPGSSLKGFSKVQIDPILVWYASDSKYQGIDPNELASVTEKLVKSSMPQANDCGRGWMPTTSEHYWSLSRPDPRQQCLGWRRECNRPRNQHADHDDANAP